MKKKILHVIGNLSMGGAERQCIHLLENINSEEFEVGIAYLNEGSKPPSLKNIQLFKIERGNYINIKNIYQQIRNIFDLFQPHLAHVWLPEIVTVPASIIAYKRNIPIVAGHRKTINFSTDLVSMMRDFLRMPQYILSTTIVSNFDVSEELLPFRFLYKKKNGQCIYNGINTERLMDLNQEKLPSTSINKLIFAGRLAPQKGLKTILKSMKYLKDVEDVHLFLFGKGARDYEKKLKDFTNKLGIEEHVTFFGECHDWQKYSRDASLFIFPSKSEGTSNSVLEAIASGVTLVISDITMSRHLLKNKENAIIIKNSSSTTWSKEIQSLLNNKSLRDSLRNNASLIMKKFSIKSMVTKYEDLYKDLLNGFK